MDFLEIDKKWQGEWFQKKVFEPKTGGKKKFFFTIPYPYVSGTLHVGHGRTYTNGDIIARFKRMQGFNVLWPMAFHITGTPVLAISSKISSGNEDTIKLYTEYVGIYEKDDKQIEKIVKSFTEPWNIVKYFSGKLIQDFKSIGYSLDLSRQFTTGDLEYNKFIEWQFHKYKEKNYLKQGNYPILYCPKDENAVGEDDISGGDEEKVQVQEFITLKFKDEKEDAYLVSATLRPDTFFGITNMFVNPQGIYTVIEMDGGKIIVSREAVEKLKLQGKKVKIMKELEGKELVGRIIKTPDGKSIPILPGEFVDANHGTGFVHSVPSHAPFDHVAIEDLKKNKKILEKYPGLEELVNKITYLPVIECEGFGKHPAKEICERMKVMNQKEKIKLGKATEELYKKEFYSGKIINSKEFDGLNVKDAKEKISSWIIEKNYGFKFYETSSRANCRCGEKIVVAIMEGQWFIDFNAGNWKKLSRECLKKMIIYPEGHRKQFEDVIEWLDKRPCARKRGLGTKLPFNKNWIIESLSDSTIYMAFYTVIKKIRELKIKTDEMTPEFFDYIFLGKGKGDKKWKEIKKEFEYWYPNDLRHTAIAHITNHLSFSIFAHTAIFEKKDWIKGFSLNDMLISEGRKMSKSKGNVVMLNAISKEFGADSFRLYISSAADFGSVLDFRKKDAESAKKNLERFFEFFKELIRIKKTNGKGEKTHLTRWMKSSFERSIKESTDALEGFEIRDYTQTAFYKLLNNFEYFYRKAGDKEKKEIVDSLLERWIKLLCPVIPHLAEELWKELGKKEFVSLEEFPKVNKKDINEEVENVENYLKNILEDVERIKKLVRIKATKVTLIVSAKEKVKKLKKELKKEDAEKAEYFPENIGHLKKNFYKIKDSFKELNEKKIIEDGKKFLEQETGLEVIAEEEEKSKNEKRTKAFPNKPAIILE